MVVVVDADRDDDDEDSGMDSVGKEKGNRNQKINNLKLENGNG